MQSRLALAGAAALSLASFVAAQTPLINQRYSWPYSGPYKVDTTNGPRGIQTGVNQCNTTTAGQTSLCVNAVVNSATDFCIYAPPDPNSIIANVEGECVAWCNSAKYGTRVIPDSAVTGMLFVKTPGYVALALNINGPLLNVQTSDAGGELDPHGADQRGNPIGSLMYSSAFSGSQINQVIEWHEFISGTQICLKACLATTTGDNNLCDNVHDTSGCNVNVPLPYDTIGTTFRSCAGENQLPPASNLGASIFTPAISNCQTLSSAAIFSGAPSVSMSSSAASSSSASVSSSASTTGPTSSVSRASMSSASSSAPASSRSGGVAPTAVPMAGLALAAGAAVYAAW